MDVDDNIKPKQQPPFNKNLIRNHSGNLGFSEWSCSASEMSIEHPPYRSNPHPFLHIDHCFVTSFFMATKTLTVDLIQEGFDADILDKQRPPIRVSEYVNHRDDCGAVYQLNVLLKDEKDRPIKTTKGQPETAVRFDAKIEMRQWKDLEWVKVEHVFDSYPAGVRKVEITSGGKDTQFWSGNYGAKMALASVVAEDKTKLEETKELFDMTRAREDILEQILVRVHPKTLLQAVPLVCQRWSELLSQQSFWVEQARVTGFEFGWIPKSGSVWETIFRSNPRLYRQKPFNRNLIPNSSGEDRTRHWAITNDEIIPRDLDITELNPQVPTKRCFATNDYGTEHSIVVDLTEYGIDAHILEQMRPRIRVSEWFTKIKPDAKYEFTAKLLDEQGHLSGGDRGKSIFQFKKDFQNQKGMLRLYTS